MSTSEICGIICPKEVNILTPDQKKAHLEMMEVLEEIEFWLKRIAKKMGADKDNTIHVKTPEGEDLEVDIVEGQPEADDELMKK